MSGFCGCCYWSTNAWAYLPQVSLQAHATILSSAARTTLTQTFINPSESLIKEVSYTFPLYDGVSVVGFQCRVGSRLLHSKVKTKEQAQSDYQDAVANQQTAAIMDHSTSQNDIFTIRLGNVPAKETITIDITFVGELKQDSQSDGIRYTLPNSIAPRYGNLGFNDYTHGCPTEYGLSADLKGISITVDVLMEKDSVLRELQSPSHSVKVSLGRMSSTPADTKSFDPSKASATLRLVKGDHVQLERDFVLVVKADGLDNPRALLETHSTLPDQRALMATLVPKFSLPPAQPEVVFVIDRSGSMHDKIPTLQQALRIFLKSLPVGLCFNICSFGSSFSFLWPTSRVYDASSLEDALSFVSTLGANMGGTEMQAAVVATVENRLKHKDLEVLLLTDGQIFNQQYLFDFVRSSAADNNARFFSLAIGDAASHSLVEGIARAGNGFSQSVIEYEELDRKVVRMLKGALTPHIFDYTLEVQYDGKADDDFEVVDSDVPTSDSGAEAAPETPATSQQTPTQQPISLFDANLEGSDAEFGSRQQADDKNLPNIRPPRALQAPYKIPPLYPFIRTTVYLLLDPRSAHRSPQSLIFRATSKLGPLELQIPISDSGTGETIHQLASRKAVIELEENHGWLQDTRDESGNPFQQFHLGTQQRLAARECQRLGVKYQVTGKYCSFVALEEDDSSNPEKSPPSKETEPRAVPLVQVVQTSHHSSGPFSGRIPAPMHGGNYAYLSYSSGGPQRNFAARAMPGAFASMRPRFRNPQPVHMGAFGSGQAANSTARARQNTSSGASTMNLGPNSSAPLFCAQSPPPPPPPPPSASGAALFGGQDRAPIQLQQNVSALSSPKPFFGGAPHPPPARRSLFEGFGQAQNPAQSSAFGAPSGSLFGSRTPYATGGSLFGSPPPAAPSSMPISKASLVARQEGNTADSALFANTSKVHTLVALQTFEGNWEWKQDLFDVLGSNMADTQAKVLRLLQAENLNTEVANVAATLLALGFLVNKNAELKAIWELVHGKAEAWIFHKLPQIGAIGEVIATHKNDIMALV